MNFKELQKLNDSTFKIGNYEIRVQTSDDLETTIDVYKFNPKAHNDDEDVSYEELENDYIETFYA